MNESIKQVIVHRWKEVLGHVMCDDCIRDTLQEILLSCLTVMCFVFLSLDETPNGQPEGEWTAIDT